MTRNQQIQNFVDALEQATGISVDADLTAESVTVKDSDGDELAIGSGGEVTVSDDGNFEIQSVTVEAAQIVDPDGDELEIAPSGAALTIEDVPESLIVDDLTVPAGEVMFVPSGEEIGVMDLVVEDTATIVVDGYVEVFGDLTETGTISGTGEVTDRVL